MFFFLQQREQKKRNNNNETYLKNKLVYKLKLQVAKVTISKLKKKIKASFFYEKKKKSVKKKNVIDTHT